MDSKINSKHTQSVSKSVLEFLGLSTFGKEKSSLELI